MKLLITEPTIEPVSLFQARDHLRLEDGEQDELVVRCVKAARQHVERRTGRSLVRQQWRQYFDFFPPTMFLEPSPVKEVERIQYVDTDGATQTLATSVYEFDEARQIIRLAYEQTWPSSRPHPNSVWADLWCGYYSTGDSPIRPLDNLPEDLTSAILLVTGELFENREQSVIGLTVTASRTFEMLIQPHRVL